MRWTHPLDAATTEMRGSIGGKAHGLAVLKRLGLPVPPGFVVGTEACRHFLHHGRLPDGLKRELAAAMTELEARTQRRFGGPGLPLAVAVRSGASVSMPGMMATILNLGLTDRATAGLAVETGSREFALSSRDTFLSSFAEAFKGAGTLQAPPPDNAVEQLELAITAVFSSWNAARARSYREVHDIPHHLGTAVVVQAMVFGNRDDHSGTGVVFTRNPNTGEPVPFGEVMFGHQGDDVVSGRSRTRPLSSLADREPQVWADLLNAVKRVEEHYRDACYLEFTFESGHLYLLQVRTGQFTGPAAVRLVTDLVDEGMLRRPDAMLRIRPRDLENVHIRRIADTAGGVVATGTGACPGVAVGRAALTADTAVRMASDGPVILVRPETSPRDMHGLAAAAGILTARGGPASHAAVVARAMNKPAVVGADKISVDGAHAAVEAGELRLAEGTVIAIDGSSGLVVFGNPDTVVAAEEPSLRRLLEWADEVSGRTSHYGEVERLQAAQAVLQGRNRPADPDPA